MFWSGSSQISSRLESMRNAEARLVALARRFGGRDPSSYEMKVFDTPIPHSSVPLKKSCSIAGSSRGEEELTIHGIHIASKEHDSASSTKTPLVLQHGYMNGGLYFFRNLVGLSRYFQNVYAIDMLGWGLSSRPNFSLRDSSVETTEEFFVESLEEWRKSHKIDKMILAGHSMGGYLSVAYCEKYPQYVERLVLLSPVGVPLESQQVNAIRKNATFSRRMFLSLYTSLFENGTTPCSVLRALPRSKSRQYVESYVKHRLPAITDPEEQDAVSSYLFHNAILPGSGEYCLNNILNANVIAKKPLVNRIPSLQVPHVSFLYGSSDWMDYSGGLDTQTACENQQRMGFPAPKVQVYGVRDAGHLLMLDNWEEFNAAVILGSGGGHTLSTTTTTTTSSLPINLSSRPQDNLQNGINSTQNEALRQRRVAVAAK